MGCAAMWLLLVFDDAAAAADDDDDDDSNRMTGSNTSSLRFRFHNRFHRYVQKSLGLMARNGELCTGKKAVLVSQACST